MEFSNIQIIANPTAGNGKGEKIALYVKQKIEQSYSFPVNLFFTQKQHDATLATQIAITRGSSLIISVGGDGTINEIVNGFFNEGKLINPTCELGIINSGTGSGYARTLRIPRSIDRQIELILLHESIKLDVGSITYRDLSNRSCKRLFVNECQVGIGSKVASVVGKKQKALGGTIAFGLTATIQAILFKPLKIKIKYDNELILEQSLIGLVIGNGLDCAGGMKLTPDAKLNDGLFDVLSMHEMNILQRMLNLSKVYSGKHILSPYFSIKRCKKLLIESKTLLLMEADGEILGYTPFEIEVIPSVIRVKVANYLNN